MSTPYPNLESPAPVTFDGPTEDVRWAVSTFSSESRKSYALYRAYYDGQHRLAFASEKLQTAFGRLFKAFADNLCPTVVETVKDRLKLDGFVIPGEEGEDPIIPEEVNEIWRRNRLMVRANQVHLDSLIEGDSYVIVWPNAEDEDFPTFHPVLADNIAIDYDDDQPGYIIRAAKKRLERDGKYRIVLYYRDRIEKWVTREKPTGGGFPDRAEAFVRLQTPNEPWPIPNPYDKVPVFHFGNRVSIGMLGCSELREAVPVQDALNKSVADELVAGEFYGVPQRWAIGLEDDLTEAVAAKRYPLKAGGVWGTTSKEAQFGEFSPADIAKFRGIVEDWRKEVARVSRTPLHFFSLEGEIPSGESLKTAESPLTAKVEDRQTTWGAVWGDAMRFALQILGKSELEPQAKWRNTTPRDESAEVTRAATKVKELQIPYEQVWRELGYTEKQIEVFTAERLKRQQEQIELQRAKFAANPVGKKEEGKVNGDSKVVQ